MIEKMPRWIKSSLTSHFNTVLSSTLSFYCEGDRRPVTEGNDRVEFRLDGPLITPLSGSYYTFFVEVNLLLTTFTDSKDIYRHERRTGDCVSAFTNSIGVFKYGDDDTLIDCMNLISGERTSRGIVISNFGLIDPPNKIMQTSVEGHYEFTIKI